MDIKKILSNKIVAVLLLLLLAFLGNIKYRQFALQKSIDKEKQNLSDELSAFEEKNAELNQSLSYINSDSFKERVARQQLNMKKEGELVYNFSEESSGQGGEVKGASTERDSNFKKWWNYFTHQNF